VLARIPWHPTPDTWASWSSAMKVPLRRLRSADAFGERELPGDGTLAATFKCPTCGRVVALLTNPMETQLVSSWES